MEDQERHPIERILEELDITRHPGRIKLLSYVVCGLDLFKAFSVGETTAGLVYMGGAGAAYIAGIICDNEIRKARREM